MMRRYYHTLLSLPRRREPSGERSSFWIPAFAGMIEVLCVGCSSTSSSATNTPRGSFTAISPIQLETKDMRIERIWGPHSKVSESTLSIDEIYVGMEFSKFELILNSQGFSSEWTYSASHHLSENINCQHNSGISEYSFAKIEIVNGQKLLHLSTAVKCPSEKDNKVWLLEGMPTLEKYEIL